MVLDIKGELYEATAEYRKTLGPVFVIDPEAVGHQFDPLHGRFTERQLYAAAKYLLYEEGERDPIFIQRGMKMLTQLFLAAGTGKPGRRLRQIPPLTLCRATHESPNQSGRRAFARGLAGARDQISLRGI